jgi:asparagine synthetase B (glutamine-hydrolysing)
VLASDAVAEPDPRRVLGKRALRAAFAARLPAAVLAERKRGFAAPLDRWLRDDDWLADLLRDRRTRAREHVDGRGLGAMLDRHRAGSARLGHALYLVAAWEVYERVVEEAP